MTGERAISGLRAPGFGMLLIVLFVVLITASSTLRHYWPLLVLSAAVAAAPFLLRSPPPHVATPLRPHVPDSAADERVDAVAMVASAITMSKASAAPDENEDAHGIDPEGGYVAIADGASSSFGAAEWARTLCGTFLRRRPLDVMPSQAWISEATSVFRQPQFDDEEWFVAEAAQRGAHAAFAGVGVLRQEERLRWRAVAVGDCVVIHLRTSAEGDLPIVTAFPIAHSAAFPARPVLLSSAADGHPPVCYIAGSASIGDIWLLMTDELARFALRRHESGDSLWAFLARGSEAEIRSLVASARASGAVADDDMTLVRCEAVRVP